MAVNSAAARIAPPDALAPFAAEDTLSLSERAYRRLRDAIAGGDLPAGTQVSERSLGARLGVSAQPVREALRRLEAEGMVRTTPRSGTVVAAFDDRRIAALGQVRAALEGAAAALAACHATDAELDALREQLRLMRAATDAGDLDALARANGRFHALLRCAAGDAFLSRSLETLRAYDHLARLRALRASPDEPGRALREHAALLSAIRRRDPDLAEARMRAHVGRSLRVGGLATPAPRPPRATRTRTP